MDHQSVFIHNLFGNLKRHNAVAGCFRITAQDKVHAAAVDDSAALPEVVVPVRGRTLVGGIEVGEAGRHVHVHVQGQRFIRAVGHFFIQLAAVRIHHVEVLVLDGGNNVGNRVIQAFPLHAVGVGILPPVVVGTDLRHLEPAFHTNLDSTEVVMGIGGVTGNDERVIQFVIVLVVRLDRGVFHIFGIDGYFGAEIQGNVRGNVIFNHLPGRRILVVIGAVCQGHGDPGFAGDGDINMVD